MEIVDDLKRKMVAIGSEIEELKSRINGLHEQKAAFAVVIRAYDPNFAPEASVSSEKKRAKGARGSASVVVTQLLKGRNNRHIVLDLLRRHDRLMSSVDLAEAFAHDEGLPPDHERQTALASRFAGTLCGLEKQGMVTKVETDGRRFLWEVAR